MIFFTSDHHFGHENIIKYCNRPFSSVDNMDNTMINIWNDTVGNGDTVYYLGDFTLGDDSRKYFYRLNGKIKILKYPWHHDKRWLKGNILNPQGYLPKSKSELSIIGLNPLVVLEFPEYGDRFPLAVSLCHYPLAEWDRKHYGAWHLHGHSHGKHKADGLIMDIGVDSNDFAPVSLNDVEKKMRSLGWKIVSN